jgi:hypothetical protein
MKIYEETREGCTNHIICHFSNKLCNIYGDVDDKLNNMCCHPPPHSPPAPLPRLLLLSRLASNKK